MLFIMIIGFYTTRLTLQFLGDEDFGINNIVAGITAMFAILSMPIVTAQQRFFNVELSKDKLSESIIFSTSARLIVFLSLMLFVLFETIGVYVINNIIVVPVARRAVINIIFQITAATNILSLLYIPYQAFLYAKEKIHICAAIDLIVAVLKLLFLLLIPSISIDHLISYCSIFLLLSIFSLLTYALYCKRSYPLLRFSFHGDSMLFKRMWKFSAWNSIESVSGIFLTYGSNILINIFGGVLYNTAYGISKQLSDAINNFSLNVLKATEPQITNSHVLGDKEYRNRLLRLAVVFSMLITGYISIIFINEGRSFLVLWLQDVPEYTLEFSVIATLTCIFTAVRLPLRSLIMASGKIKGFFVSYGLLTVFILAVGYLLLSYKYTIVLVMYLLLLHSFLFVVLSIFILRKEISYPVGGLVKHILLTIMFLGAALGLYYWIKNQVEIFFLSTILASICSGIFLTLCFYCSLDIKEKFVVKSVIAKFKLKK